MMAPPRALIVGGTTGLGLSVSRCLLARGFEIVTVGRSPAPEGVIDHFVCDLADSAAWRATMTRISSAHTSLAVVGFITGYARAVSSQDATSEDRAVHYRLNADYVADAYDVLANVLQPAAKLFTIGSQWTFRRGCPWLIPYIMAKQALLAVTLELRNLPQAPHIRHYCVPTMNTPAFAEVRASFGRLGLEREFTQLGFAGALACPDEVSAAMTRHLFEDDSNRTVWQINANYGVHVPIPIER